MYINSFPTGKFVYTGKTAAKNINTLHKPLKGFQRFSYGDSAPWTAISAVFAVFFIKKYQ